MKSFALPVALSWLFLVSNALADTPPSQNEALYQTVRNVINRGATLYNSGDPAAAYRLFEGSLMTLKPSLDQRPELQKAIEKALTSAEKDPVTWRRAFTLRDALDKVRLELKNGPAEKLEKLKPPSKEEEKEDPDKDIP